MPQHLYANRYIYYVICFMTLELIFIYIYIYRESDIYIATIDTPVIIRATLVSFCSSQRPALEAYLNELRRTPKGCICQGKRWRGISTHIYIDRCIEME
jgi:hypothetical protein